MYSGVDLKAFKAQEVDEIFQRSLLEDILPAAAAEFTETTEVPRARL